MSTAQPSPIRPLDIAADEAIAAESAPARPSSDSLAGITPPRRRGGAARFISDVVVELGFLPKERVDGAVEEGKATGRSPEDVLVASGALSVDQLARATAERFGLDHVDLTVYKPDLAAVNLLTAQAARRYNAIPIGFHQSGTLLVAMADPSNVLALDDLKLMTGYEVRPVVASREDIAALIAKMNRLDDAVAAVVDDEEEDEALVAEIRVGRGRAGHQARQLDHRPGGRGRRVRHPLRAARPGHARALPRRRRAVRDHPIPRRMVPGAVAA